MGELVFFAVIILFSVLESIARARKKRGEEGSQGPVEGEDPARPEGRRRDPRVSGGDVAGRDPSRADERGASETMVPQDLWEEIAGLAAGRPAPSGRAGKKPSTSKRSRPRQAEPRPQVPSSGSVPELRGSYTSKALETDVHPVHRSHAGYGTDPSARAPSEQDWRPRETGNPNAKRVRAMLRGSEGADALKQAVILREVLGPPAAMKDD